MAEQARCNQWQRVFPCIVDPMRYLDKFEMQRSDTARVCQALKGLCSSTRGDVQAAVPVLPAGRAWR